jgi:hypothetical protein
MWVKFITATSRHSVWQVMWIENRPNGWTWWYLQWKDEKTVMEVPPGYSQPIYVYNELGYACPTVWPIPPYQHDPNAYEESRDQRSLRPLNDPLNPREIWYVSRAGRTQGTAWIAVGILCLVTGLILCFENPILLICAVLGIGEIAYGVRCRKKAADGYRVYGDLEVLQPLPDHEGLDYWSVGI